MRKAVGSRSVFLLTRWFLLGFGGPAALGVGLACTEANDGVAAGAAGSASSGAAGASQVAGGAAGSIQGPVGGASAEPGAGAAGAAGAAGSAGSPPVVVVAPSPIEWHQDAHDAQRTGYSPIEPETPWELVFKWNGSGATAGSTDEHFYEQPEKYVPWEARTVTGAGRLYVPASAEGLYALALTDGEQAWHLDGTFNATPAFDPSTQALFAGADDGTLFKIDAETGQISGSYDAGAPLKKSVLVAGDAVYVAAQDGVLHKVQSSSMQGVWTYDAGSATQTMPAYSATADVIVFGTADLYVHAVGGSDGKAQWHVKPNQQRQAGYPYEFEGGWPVVAEQHGIVFLRMNQGIGLIFGSGSWALGMAQIREQLQAAPEWKNLFALALESGAEAFVPAVAPQGVEDFGASPNLRVHSFPVVKTLAGGQEVAYQTFRAAPREQGWDARWDSHVGEMVLDGDTVPNLAAGDLRFIDFPSAYPHITDENCPLTMAGDTLFFSHWVGTGAYKLEDRSDALGSSAQDPISTSQRPSFARAQTCASAAFDALTHFSMGGVSYDHEVGNRCTGRSLPGPAFYSYFGVLDPPTPARDAYSEGILPRYTYVSGQYIVFEGNGGDLVVLRHSGQVPDK